MNKAMIETSRWNWSAPLGAVLALIHLAALCVNAQLPGAERRVLFARCLFASGGIIAAVTVVLFALRGTEADGWGRRLRRAAFRGVMFFGTSVACMVAAEYILRWHLDWTPPDRQLARPAAPAAGPRVGAKNPYFFEIDRRKVWNRKFYEQNQAKFEGWPVAVELFDSDKPAPFFLWMPNRCQTSDDVVEKGSSTARPWWTTNAWGFRGEDFPVEKPPGTLRVVCLGASTTAGCQVDHQTYPVALERRLKAAFPGRALEVLNAGHHGHHVEDSLEVLRRRILPLKPDLVIHYEGNNDIEREEYCPHSRHPVPRLRDRRFIRSSILLRTLVERLGLDHAAPESVPHVFDDTSPKPSALKYGETLREMARECQRHNVRLVLSSFVTLAHEGFIVERSENPEIYDCLYHSLAPFTAGELARIYANMNRQSAAVARELGLPYADAAARFPREIRYFVHDLHHFSPEGNELLAGIFAETLRRDVLRAEGGALTARPHSLDTSRKR